MQKSFYSVCAIAVLCLLMGACSATKQMTQSLSSSPPADEDLYAQVPSDQRQGVYTAENKLQRAADGMVLAAEKLKLAKFRQDLATKRQKLAEQRNKLAKLIHEQSIVAVDIAKWEAIDAEGLGQKENNIKTLYNLRTKKAKIETEQLKYRRDIETLQLQEKELVGEVRTQEATVASLE